MHFIRVVKEDESAVGAVDLLGGRGGVGEGIRGRTEVENGIRVRVVEKGEGRRAECGDTGCCIVSEGGIQLAYYHP